MYKILCVSFSGHGVFLITISNHSFRYLLLMIAINDIFRCVILTFYFLYFTCMLLYLLHNFYSATQCYALH